MDLVKQMRIRVRGYLLYLVFVATSFYFWPLIILAKLNENFASFYYSTILKIIFSIDFGFSYYYPTLFEQLYQLRQQKGQPLTIVEIGPGTGINLNYYPPDTNLITIEKNEPLESVVEDKLHTKFQRMKLVKAIVCDVTKLSPDDIADGSIDIVVGTHVLCCIQNDVGTIKQVKRILKPGGKFFTLEIVQRHPSEQGVIERVIRTSLRPFFRLVTLGCRVGTQLPQSTVLHEMGFDVTKVKTLDCPVVPIYFSTTTFGVAVKK